MEVTVAQSPCRGCREFCCMAVKHLPYQGETSQVLFSSMLVGAFPDLDDADESSERTCPDEGQVWRRPFVTEWLIPAEVEACPMWDHEGLCSIYDHRPVACRQFPVNSDGTIHPFCPRPQKFRDHTRPENRFAKINDLLDLYLLGLQEDGGRAAVLEFLMEDETRRPPLLYNSYLLSQLILAGGSAIEELECQKMIIKKYELAGNDQLTFIIPGTDYCISAPTESLYINLQYLIARIEQKGLQTALEHRLKGITRNIP